MIKLRRITLLVLFLAYSVVEAQNIADKYFDENKFETAVSIYQKTYDKGKADAHVIQRLGLCYQKLNRYSEAEKYFAEVVKLNNTNPENFLYYGQILKNQNKINQAREQFKTYLEKKDSEQGRLLLQSCDSIGYWTQEPTNFVISNIENINSSYIEISPFPIGNKIVFSSNRKENSKSKNEENIALEFDAYSLYLYNPSNKEKSVDIFSKELNTNSNTESNAYFNDKFDQIIYTRAFENSSGQLEIHFAHKSNDAWINDEPFNRNDPKFSFTNPVLSNDESTIYFASDMLGGKGGMDIWKSTKKGLLYSKPVNLGEKINTPGNEIPSYIDEKGNLYFSSNYHPGFGGMDIFIARNNNGEWSKIENLKSPFNSSKDDLGYIQINAQTGYFTSNREGGKGRDDIYSYSIIPFSDKSFYKNVSGNYSSESQGVQNKKMVLLIGNDVIIRTSVTDEFGNFEFNNIPSVNEYNILIDENAENIPANGEIYITNKDNNNVKLINRIEKDVFEFTLLDLEPAEDLSFMDEFDESGLPTLTILGQLEGNNSEMDLGKKRVYIVDGNGKILASTLSDHLGKFQFEKLSIDEQYLFKLEEEDASIDIQIINTKGEIIGRTVKNKDGNYVYHKFTINPSDNPDIRGVFKFGNLPADGVMLMLLNEDDEVVQIVTTDKKGAFDFKALESGSRYKIQVDTNLDVPANASLFLMDSHTGTLMPVSKLANGTFNFETLAPIPPEELALMAEEDYVFKPRTNIKGMVFSKSEKQVPTSLAIEIQDVNGKIVAISKTDQKGKFEFFNLPLEDQYLFRIPEDDQSYGIRILADNESVICETVKNNSQQYVYHKFTINPSERPDIRGVFKYGNLPANDVSLNLMGENDDVLQVTKTNALGEFIFTEMYAGKSYRIAVDPSEKNVPSNTSLYLQDVYTGLMLPVSKLSNGQFKFETLKPMQAEELALIEVEEDDNLQPTMSFFGQIFSTNTSISVEGKKVNILDSKGNIIGVAITDKYGKFDYQKLPIEDEYLLRIMENDPNFNIKVLNNDDELLGYLDKKDNKNFLYNRNQPLSAQLKEVKEEKVASTINVTLNKEYKPYINFEFGGYNLTGESEKNLDYLAEYLKSEKELKLEISSHTDSKGSAEFNLKLSAQRGNKVKSYLVNRGVQSNRIIVKSFGETQLLNECSDDVECPPEKHAENRRVELKYSK